MRPETGSGAFTWLSRSKMGRLMRGREWQFAIRNGARRDEFAQPVSSGLWERLQALSEPMRSTHSPSSERTQLVLLRRMSEPPIGKRPLKDLALTVHCDSEVRVPPRHHEPSAK